MITPRVTEIPLRLAPVERDPFVDAPSRVARRPPSRREARERRMESVRNGWPAARTQRA
jgi:hypothetical protein